MRPKKPSFSSLLRGPKAVRLWWFRARKQLHCVECAKRLYGVELLQAGVCFLELLKGSGFPCPHKSKPNTDGCQNCHLRDDISR